MIEITFSEQGLWNAATYFIGLYSQLTKKQIAFVEVESEQDLEFYKDTIISPPEVMVDMKFKIPKTKKFSDKIQLKFDLFEKFMIQNCSVDKDHQILGMLLLSNFGKFINDSVEPIHEFPSLMKLFVNKYPQLNIQKATSSKGAIYKGITLTGCPNTLQQSKKVHNSKQSKTFKLVNTLNSLPISQSTTSHSIISNLSISESTNSQSTNLQLIGPESTTPQQFSSQSIIPQLNIFESTISEPTVFQPIIQQSSISKSTTPLSNFSEPIIPQLNISQSPVFIPLINNNLTPIIIPYQKQKISPSSIFIPSISNNFTPINIPYQKQKISIEDKKNIVPVLPSVKLPTFVSSI